MATNRQLNINGRIYTTDADSDASLLFVLRDQLDLTVEASTAVGKVSAELGLGGCWRGLPGGCRSNDW